MRAESLSMPTSLTYVFLWVFSSWVSSISAAAVPAKPHSYGEVVRIVVNGTHKCGGTILSREWVLTSSSCLYQVKYKDTKVIVGDHKLSEEDVPEQELNVKQFILHQGYKLFKEIDDIALILVYPAIEFSPNTTATNIPDCGKTQYEEGVVVGWGKNNYKAAVPSDELMEQSVKLISGDECKKKLSMVKPAYVFCAEVDTCAGDSGGPIFLKKPTHLEQIGVYSFAYSDCKVGVTVFTKISAYAPWIDKRIRGCGDFNFHPDLHEKK